MGFHQGINKKIGCRFFYLCFVVVLFLWLPSMGSGKEGSFAPRLQKNGTKKVVQVPVCEFEVVVSEPDFCMIQGTVYDIGVALLPVSGVCSGSETVRVGSLPAGVTAKILPSPKLQFANDGIASAVVRINTKGIDLKEGRATSTLTFSVSRKDTVHTAKANMMIDLPSFDFSIKPSPSVVEVFQENQSPASIRVKTAVLGAACQQEKQIVLSLDTSSLPKSVRYDLSPKFVTPPEEATLSFYAKSDMEIGLFKAELVGCCTGQGAEKTVKVALNLSLPDGVDIPGEAGSPQFPKMKGTYKIESAENLMSMLQLPKEAMEQAKKRDEDLAKKGYIEVSEEDVQKLKRDKTHVVPMSQIRLAFEPALIKSTPLERFSFHGGYPSGANIGGEGGGWTTVTRIFTMPNGVLIGLTESDLTVAGGQIIYSEDAVNETINGVPAVFIVQQSPSGQAMSSITWTTATTDYTLGMEGNVRKNGQKKFLLDLANSIPK
jgi:hypothetical protein